MTSRTPDPINVSTGLKNVNTGSNKHEHRSKNTKNHFSQEISTALTAAALLLSLFSLLFRNASNWFLPSGMVCIALANLLNVVQRQKER